MTFLFDANCKFEAFNLDDAFGLLRMHFAYLRDSEDSEGKELQFTGEMRLAKE